MRDAVDPIMDQQNEKLLNDFFEHNSKSILDFLSSDSKKDIFKTVICNQLENLTECLNKAFGDVKFRVLDGHESSSHDGEMYTYVLRDFYDEENINTNVPVANDIDMEGDFQNLTFKFEYYWIRKCSLKCQHVTKRWYIMGIAKVLDLLAWWRNGLPARNIVEKYMPDFFYDPMEVPKRKPGRPRKHHKPLSSSKP